MGTPVSVILHTIVFGSFFMLLFFGVSFNLVLLILTTLLSIEAIYLALFIQITVNRNTKSLEEVEEDIEEIQEDVEGLEGDVEEISEEIEDIAAEDIKTDMEEEQSKITLKNIEEDLEKLQSDISALRSGSLVHQSSKKYLKG
ncbi:DUF1003 domain-containing protein [Candidatus Daviesbacteria bacterium]|nr:DUF1003 domain-containing protein [Candidatus Daviesbacteria bacterium]